jgi:hypothetical protein
MNDNGYRVRAQRGEVQIGTWINMIRTPARSSREQFLRRGDLELARMFKPLKR